MQRLAVIPLLLVLIASSVAAVPLSNMNYLRSISCAGEAGAPIVVLSFDLKAGLDDRVVRYSAKHNYVLVTLPSTYVNPARRVFSVDHPAVESILAVQRDAETTNIKIQFAEGTWIATGGLAESVVDGKLTIAMKTDGTAARAPKPAPANVETTPRSAAEQPAEQPAEQAAEQAADEDSTAIDPDLLGNQVQETVGVDLASEYVQQKAREEALIEAVNEEPADESGAALFDFGSKEGTPGTEAPTMGGSLVKLIAAFFLVIGAILIGSQWMKRNNWAKKALGLDNEVIKIVGTHNLGLKRSLMVVEIGGEKIVLAVTGNDVRFLTKSGADAAAATDNGPDAKTLAFADHLARSQGGDEGYRRAAAGALEITPGPLDDGDTVTAIRKRIASLKRL